MRLPSDYLQDLVPPARSVFILSSSSFVDTAGESIFPLTLPPSSSSLSLYHPYLAPLLTRKRPRSLHKEKSILSVLWGCWGGGIYCQMSLKLSQPLKFSIFHENKTPEFHEELQ